MRSSMITEIVRSGEGNLGNVPRCNSRRAKVTLVLPVSCGACGGKWVSEIRTEKGLKCERLEATLRCGACGERRSISFCLPELG